MTSRVVFALAALSLAGCLSKAEPVVQEHIRPIEVASPAPTSSAARGALRLREVSGADYLHEPVFWVWEGVGGFRDDLRWTERPSAYLESALSRALFLERGVRRATGSGAPTLDARLRRFDVIAGPQRAVEVEVDLLVTDDRGLALLERRVREQEPLTDANAEQVSAAMGRALARAVASAADLVTAALPR